MEENLKEESSIQLVKDFKKTKEYKEKTYKDKQNIINVSVLLGILIVGFIIISILTYKSFEVVIFVGCLVLIITGIMVYTIIKTANKIKKVKFDNKVIGNVNMSTLLYIDENERSHQIRFSEVKRILLDKDEKTKELTITVFVDENNILTIKNILNSDDVISYFEKNIFSKYETLKVL